MLALNQLLLAAREAETGEAEAERDHDDGLNQSERGEAIGTAAAAHLCVIMPVCPASRSRENAYSSDAFLCLHSTLLEKDDFDASLLDCRTYHH